MRFRIHLAAAALIAALPSSRAVATDRSVAPYTAFAWTAPTTQLPQVVGLVRYQSSSNPIQVAKALSQLPPGRRFLLRWESNDNRFWRNPQDQLVAPAAAATQPLKVDPVQGPWADHGAAAEAAFETRFAAALQQCAVVPDFLVLDTEFGLNTFQLNQRQLDAILADRRWPQLARAFGVRTTTGLLHTDATPDVDRPLSTCLDGVQPRKAEDSEHRPTTTAQQQVKNRPQNG